jgi:hypothetical protein
MKPRKPIARSQKPIRRTRKVKKSSLRYEVVLNGAVRVYPDGREVCQENRAGREEYKRRTLAMANWQENICGICGFGPMLRHQDSESPLQVTFQHGDGRGMGGARRDDRTNVKGNCAAHRGCNGELGSRRI